MLTKLTKSPTLFSLSMLLFAGVLSAAGNVTEETVKVRQIIGTAEIRSSGSSAWRPARLGMIMKTGWDLRTFVESSAELEFESGTIIRLGENSVVTLSALSAEPGTNATNTLIKVPAGQLWANVKKITSLRSRFDFETPTAVASIRGTRLGIKVLKGKTFVDVYDGSVAVRNKGSGRETRVNSREQAVVVREQDGIMVKDLGEGKDGRKDGVVVDPFTGDTLRTPPDSGNGSRVDSTKPADSALHDSGSTGGVSDSSAAVSGAYHPLPVTGVMLQIASPQDNATITSPMIPVSGSTSPGAKVTVNGMQAPVNSSGFFSAQLPLPDEAREYAVEIIARLGTGEKSEQRTVIYAPPVKPLELAISSPVEYQTIKTSSIHIVGKTSEGAVVKINSRPAVVSARGIISMDLQVGENDIGVFNLEAIASRDEQELAKNISLKVDIASPQVNTSVPRVQIMGPERATRTPQLSLLAFDKTPNDQVFVTIIDNGITDNMTLHPGGQEDVVLNEGKNKLLITARDMAGNQAQPVESEIYYLPGPIEISVIEPEDNSIDVQDLPPWPRGAANMSKIHFRVEIRDNIGTVPETIKYCRVTSSGGQTVVLNNERNYFYYGDMAVGRGNTVFTIQVEDIAGTIQMKKIDMRIRE